MVTLILSPKSNSSWTWTTSMKGKFRTLFWIQVWTIRTIHILKFPIKLRWTFWTKLLLRQRRMIKCTCMTALLTYLQRRCRRMAATMVISFSKFLKFYKKFVELNYWILTAKCPLGHRWPASFFIFPKFEVFFCEKRILKIVLLVLIGISCNCELVETSFWVRQSDDINSLETKICKFSLVLLAVLFKKHWHPHQNLKKKDKKTHFSTFECF